jgi:hypothetical protein
MSTATTYRTFDAMTDDPNWLGFGYLGGRSNYLHEYDPECLAEMSSTDRAIHVAHIDGVIVRHAAARGWTDVELFAWANSKNGRWFADTAFGGTDADLDKAREWRLLELPRD